MTNPLSRETGITEATALTDEHATSLWAGAVARTFRTPLGIFSLTIVVLSVIVAIAAPLLAPHDPIAVDLAHRFEGPSSQFWAGTDYLGRDILSRLIYGARIALTMSLISVIAGMTLGFLLGIIAGYVGGVFDYVLGIIFDALLSLPAIVFALALLTLLGPSQSSTIIVITLSLMPMYGRVARSQTIAAKHEVYVKAERSLGASTPRVLFVHIMPNIMAPIVVLTAINIPAAIGISAGLAFLGLGSQPPTPDWGVMLNDGFDYIRETPWMLIGPLVALVIVTIAFTAMGELLRDAVDPSSTGRVGGRISGVGS